MSTAEGRRAGARPARGFTYVEVTIVLGMVALLSLVVERVLTGTHEGGRLLEATRRVTERGPLTLAEVHRAVGASRRVHVLDGTLGPGYLAALDLAARPRTTTSRLPRLDETGELEPDQAGDPRTGNVLLFVEEGDPVACVADPAAGLLRSVDLHRLVCVYPTATERRLEGAGPVALDLVLWRSRAYASHAQLLGVADEARRGRIVRDLVVRHGLTTAWDPTAPVASAFYAMDATGTLSALPEADPRVLEDADRSPGGRLVHAGVQLARTSATSALRAPLMAVEDPAVWAPDGFEVKLVGPSGSRKAWLRLVVESPATSGRSVVLPSTMVASVRDL